ncbi:hypothetical protein [Streptomonospora wellingtoniae]|uniref:Uncharacterized protein n=1 Tax=Streptomonospora wellingtoniae TaxID=3075544 RepID=A0ABU2KWV9_9ACTN|nr:hypothetical protein [Streptomonospora sp. DSM 45055]MDT0303782.1 hypothetical protein [Streptomonospora sp. DSM 45055]
MHAPSTLFGHLVALMHATADAVIAVSAEGTARVCPRSEVGAAEREAYSRDLLLAEGVVPTPAALQGVMARIAAELRGEGWDLVA